MHRLPLLQLFLYKTWLGVGVGTRLGQSQIGLVLILIEPKKIRLKNETGLLDLKNLVWFQFDFQFFIMLLSL